MAIEVSAGGGDFTVEIEDGDIDGIGFGGDLIGETSFEGEEVMIKSSNAIEFRGKKEREKNKSEEASKESKYRTKESRRL